MDSFTREHVAKLLPVLIAFAEGKRITYAGRLWETFSFDASPDLYKIEPEVIRYRRFKVLIEEENKIITRILSEHGYQTPEDVEKIVGFIGWVDKEWAA